MEITAKLQFECNGWGCRTAIRELADRCNLEFIYIREGGSFVFEWVNAKVRGNLSDIKIFESALEKIFN